MDVSTFSPSVLVYINGVRHQVLAADPRMTLLEYLRSPGASSRAEGRRGVLTSPQPWA